MSLGQRVSSDHQLARLLQIGVVLEEVVESRAAHHLESLPAEKRDAVDEEVRELLVEANEESADHRERLEALIDDLDAETVAYEEINALVDAQYGPPEDTDGVLYDQLCNEETAYKFYDDLIDAVEASDTEFALDRDRLLETLYDIREEEKDGAEEVTEIMEHRA
ncbi:MULTISPECIES: ferritin-like domain-containing protein [Natrialba]|uniref:Ferritin-like domain-containing protein n=1 Tax=Natrialba swarupiae TaxID=2448032 RepID=A0A5D5AG87_9EURY|nr:MULTISPECIES: ferritin-like domain-containing protein [Natrialba]MWV39834.1 ferritin-like domain-containing protein [Natrialba sp. INN-245]TYT60809.1 ferritin-like domain-containing protein [Natrialba swarupiae]